MTHSCKIIFLFCLASCSEYKLTQELDASPGPAYNHESEEDVTGLPSATVCDEIDNIDQSISVDEACIRYRETEPLDAVIEWSITEFAEYPEHGQTVMAPVIGQLTDDNQDGLINVLDTPDIVIISDDGGVVKSRHGVLRLIAGADGQQTKSVMGVEFNSKQVYPYRYSNVALGDVDWDGEPEIIAVVSVIGEEEPTEQEEVEEPEIPLPATPPETAEDPPLEETGFEDNPIRPPPPNQTKSNDPNQNPNEPKCHLAAYNNRLEVEWLSGVIEEGCGGHAPVLADLEGDGEVEIVLGHHIFRGSTGDLLASGEGDTGRFQAYEEMGFNSIVADLNGDGIQEIIAGRSVYDPNGVLICQGIGPQDGFAAAADLDMDGQGEFVVVGNQTAALYDTDCSLVHQWALQGGGTGGPPTIADYDGDMLPEIGVVDATTYSVYNPDGTVNWSTPVTDMSSHATGSLVFDFEGDGYPEVVYADELALWVFDGRTGQTRLKDEAHNSRTLHEYPTVADLDHDGSAEIVVVNGGSHYDFESTGIFTIGSETSRWQGARQVWNQHAYSITNINDDLTIPESPVPNWPIYNNFRSGDVNPTSAEKAPDAIPLAEICLEECYLDRIVVNVRVGNQGLAGLRNGLPVYVYTEILGQLSVIDAKVTSKVIASGDVSESIRFRIPMNKIMDNKLFVEVDPLRYTNECSVDNNLIQLTDSLCP